MALDEVGLNRNEDHEIRTAILHCLFGCPEAPDGWTRVASFGSSGEAECWWCAQGAGDGGQPEDCKLCEGDGVVYIGEGWAEVVYRRVG